MTAPLLELRHLDLHYGAIHALKDISLKVEPGQIVALLGANGAGKTSTLRAISGLHRPTCGCIYYDGMPINDIPAHQRVAMGIAQVPEGRGIFANFSVEENLAIGGYARRDRRQLDRDRDRALELFPRLRERLKQNAGTLSGGEQQMLAIARALLAQPKLLLLDEPSLGLAPRIVQTIFQIIREINQQGATILLVEQNAHMSLATAHFGYVLEVGSIVTGDSCDNLARSDAIKRAYLGSV